MADPATYRPAPGSIPESPGVYRFRDARGRVIYVGKAKNLRQRLNSYFADFATLHPRTQAMLTSAAAVDWTVVGTEVEALQLEYSWIKEFDPRFNVRYRDDKSYPYLAVTLNEEYPRVHGDARREAQGHAVLRALLARLGHPGDGGPAAAGVPGADLLGRGVQAGRADRPAVPARLHRQVLGALRRPGERGRAPRDRRGFLRLHGGPDRRVHPPARGEMREAAAARGVRAGRPAARRHARAAAGPGEAGRRARRRHRLRRHRARRGPARGGGAGLPRPRRPGPRPARLGGRQGRGRDDRRAGRATSSARSTARPR